MKIVAVLYPDMTALDLVGPLQVIGFFPGAQIQTVWKHTGPIRSDNGLALSASHTFATAFTDPDVLIIGGAARATLDRHAASSRIAAALSHAIGGHWQLRSGDLQAALADFEKPATGRRDGQ